MSPKKSFCITELLIALSFAMFVLTWIFPSLLELRIDQRLDSSYSHDLFIPQNWLKNWPRFLLAMFLNTSGVYLLYTSFGLWFFGKPVEKKMGALFYLMMIGLTISVSILIEGFANYLSDLAPFFGLGGVLLGAMGAYWRYFFSSQAIFVAGLFLAIQYFSLPSATFEVAWKIQTMSFLLWALGSLADTSRG